MVVEADITCDEVSEGAGVLGAITLIDKVFGWCILVVIPGCGGVVYDIQVKGFGHVVMIECLRAGCCYGLFIILF